MNILLQDWEYPPFDKIKTQDYEPAVTAAIAEAEGNIEAIVNNTEEPTFGNTIEALEKASRRLDRISAVMENLNECCTDEALQEVVMRLEPTLTRFSMKVMTDERLYERVKRCAANIEHNGTQLTTEQQTLLENTLKSFRRHGVALPEKERERFKRNAEELSELQVRFGQNALADLNDWTLHLVDEAELEGLPEAVREAAHEEARQRGMEGWLFTLAAPSYVPFMTYSARRDLRERMYRAYGSIGGRGNAHDNNGVIRSMVSLRAEQAHLLGYATYCDYVLEDRMVESLPNLRRFMEGLKEAVLPAAKKEMEEMEQMSDEGGKGQQGVMPWDVSYLSEKLKQQRYAFDSEALRPYFPLEAVREGIFGLYGRLYGLRFEPAPEVPVYHEEVRVYRVTRGGRTMGILYLDMHPRPSKRSGAWMTEFRGQYGEVRPQIQVVCNFSKPTAETPALLRFSEVETFMHEMGHAMHGMLSEVEYESLSGTNVKRDFVEMPSQVMENWCYEPEFLATFARHYQSGEPLPTEYVEKIRAAQNHMAGWLCLRQLNLGMTDIAFHTMDLTESSEYNRTGDLTEKSECGRIGELTEKSEYNRIGGLTESSEYNRIGVMADIRNNSGDSVSDRSNSGDSVSERKNSGDSVSDRRNSASAFRAEDIEASAMENLLPRVEGCCTATNFNHIFGGGYASGYYGYKWAEVLDADIFSRFKHDGIFNADTAEAFRREILCRGGSEHPAVLFRNFMGRDPDTEALLRREGLLLVNS